MSAMSLSVLSTFFGVVKREVREGWQGPITANVYKVAHGAMGLSLPLGNLSIHSALPLTIYYSLKTAKLVTSANPRSYTKSQHIIPKGQVETN